MKNGDLCWASNIVFLSWEVLQNVYSTYIGRTSRCMPFHLQGHVSANSSRIWWMWVPGKMSQCLMCLRCCASLGQLSGELEEPLAALGVCCCSHLMQDSGHTAEKVFSALNCIINILWTPLSAQSNVISKVRREGISRNSLSVRLMHLFVLYVPLKCLDFLGIKLPFKMVSEMWLLIAENKASGVKY